MAKRNEIITTVGNEYLTANVEDDEWKYSKAFKEAGKEFVPFKRPKGQIYDRVDIRFVHNNITVLIETKVNFDKNRTEYEAQLQAYVSYEKALTGNKTVAILANTDDDRILVWRGPVCDANLMEREIKLRTFQEYADFYTSKVNDKEKVMRNTYALNELLHGEGINEKLRSQFVGTCLLALKNGVKYEDRKTSEIIASMSDTIDGLLKGDVLRGEKLIIIKRKVLEAQAITNLADESFRKILNKINEEILPFINDKSTAGQDLLNLFFITFNKYVGKADKNQAFTPDHITDFMAKVCEVNRHSRVLDATCGSGSFLVRAMTQAMDDCATEAEQEEVKKNHIFGIEYDKDVFGLAATNMLIHSDGNSNIKQGSCFDNGEWISEQHIDVVLMNPPYNANKAQSDPKYVSKWNSKAKEDPSQGFHFVEFVAKHVKTGRMAVLLPMQCAIGSSKDIKKFKKSMLEEHTLDAVFSLPSDVFHPGASASVCCMVFTLGKRHNSKRPTFFGYYKEDGFRKRKNLGRVERTTANGNGMWAEIEEKWLELYHCMREVDGLSAVHCVTASDEWLAEAYMKTDYSNLSEADFRLIINNYVTYLIQISKYPSLEGKNNNTVPTLDVSKWKEFYVGRLFRIENTYGVVTDDLIDGTDVAYIAAKHDINGFEKMCSSDGMEDWVSRGNCIIFVQIGEGSCGYANYSFDDFIGMKGKTACGYIDNVMNPYIGLFLTTVLCCERPKHSFGRSWNGKRLTDTVIQLPIQYSPNGDPIIDKTYKYSDDGFVPDWQFMENYIKALPYGDRL